MTGRQEPPHADLVAEFRRQLSELRGRVFRTVTTSDNELKTLETHQPGSTEEDAARGLASSILERLGERERRELDEIYAAQARLETGSFGVCEECARPIPIARLRAMPTARYCAPCQSRGERDRAT